MSEEGQSKVLPQFIAGLAASMGAFAAGTLLGWSNPAQPPIQDGYMGFNVSDNEYSWVGSLVPLGAATVCVPIGFLQNAIGRKLTMLLLVIPFMIGWCLLLYAKNVIMMFVARYILGISGGAFCICAPVYTTEIAQDSIRGTLGSFFQMLLVCGVLYAYAMGAALEVFWFSFSCAVLPIVFLLAFITMPESPTYLVSKDNLTAALASLQRLRGAGYDCSKDLNELKMADDKIKANPVSLGKAMCRRVTLKALAISILLMIFQQLSGINAVVFYSTSIFEKAGTSITGSQITIMIGSVMVVSTLVGVLIIDKLGRKPLLLSSSGAIVITTILFGYYFYKLEGDDGENAVKSISWLPVVSLFIFMIMFSVGFGPVPWLIMAEVFTAEVKGLAGPLAGTTNWLMAFLVTASFATLRDSIGSGPTFWLYSGVSLVGFFFIIFFVPETKGKSMAEIQEMLAGTKED